ncbi:MAG: site-specific DNA-methyltransferase, partial [Anaerolineae bacterium]|nr:site-specific DNA-methyltransferase [Anaerolineae bacterium]
WYSKTQNFHFNTLYEAYSETTNLDQILQKRERSPNGKAVYARDDSGEVILNGPKKGVPLSDVWEIPYLNPKARERTGYPTQKPILLLEQMIKLTTQPEDVILDPFCGSGTALVAAELLGRQYLGMDTLPEAVELTKSRLSAPQKTDSFLLKKGRASYDNVSEAVKNLLAELPVKLVQRNAGIDAIYDEFINSRPVLIRVQREGENLQHAAGKLVRAGQKKQAGLLLLIQTRPTDDCHHAGVTVIPSTALSIQKLIEDVRGKICESG